MIISKVSTGQWRPDKGWRSGRVWATVDGHGVVFTRTGGWRCHCGQPACSHVDAVAALIDPDVLATIRSGRRQDGP